MTLAALETVASRYVGIVRHCDELLAAPDDARVVHAVATVGDGTVGGAGYAASRAAARAAALGEAVERYAAANVDPARLTLGSAAELPDAVDPATFALFTREQHRAAGFPFVPFTRSTRVRWIDGSSIAGGRRVLLPAQLVGLRWDELAESEEPIGYSTSSGVACAESFEAAAAAGLLELLERDAFMIVWRARLSLPLVDHRGDAELQAFERTYLRPASLRCTVVDLSCVHDVPVALALVRDRAGSLGVGAGAGPTMAIAWRKAVIEAYAVRSAARTFRVRGALLGDRPVTTFDDHIRFYADPEQAPRAAFLDAAREWRSVRDVPAIRGELLPALVAGLAARGLEPFAVDLTTDDVASAGLHVVRAVVPQLCPLDVWHDACFLGGRRLYDVPYELGLRPRPLRFDELNLDPHPFP